MESNSKSGLRISQIIAIISAFIIMTTATQLLVSSKNVLNETKIAEEKVEEENIVINGKRLATSRGGMERRNTIEEHIKIEEIEISKDMDLTKRCGISKEDFKELIGTVNKDTTKFFYNYSDVIYDLCEKYEINEIFFCGLIAGESGWEISKNHRAKCNYISMMSNGKLLKYETPEEGLEAAAKLLHNKYLTPGGSCYTGKTLEDIQKRFCPRSSTWVNLIYKCMNQIV